MLQHYIQDQFEDCIYMSILSIFMVISLSIFVSHLLEIMIIIAKTVSYNSLKSECIGTFS